MDYEQAMYIKIDNPNSNMYILYYDDTITYSVYIIMSSLHLLMSLL
jgi:hypothetical protein